MFKLIEVTDQKSLDTFVIASGGDFLQSWAWGDFQATQGSALLRLAVVDASDKYLAVVTLIKKSLPYGHCYWFAPRGPVIANLSDQEFRAVWSFLIKSLATRARADKIAFLRFEPSANSAQATYQLWPLVLGVANIYKTLDLEPSKTAILDLSQDLPTLLASMHHKTRYNINLAGKKNLSIKLATSSDFEAWWQLLSTTAERDEFRLHSRDYYQVMLSLPIMKLYLAYHGEDLLAGILVAQFGYTATYVHGASANQGRELMAPHLLQWRAITDAKASSALHYDFYGIDAHKWPGVTRFKAGFAGQNLAYLGTFDLVWCLGYYKFYTLGRQLFRFFSKLVR
jgi:peptidoglycan pentaglycine glycine transferase (the first glycine)